MRMSQNDDHPIIFKQIRDLSVMFRIYHIYVSLSGRVTENHPEIRKVTVKPSGNNKTSAMGHGKVASCKRVPALVGDMGTF